MHGELCTFICVGDVHPSLLQLALLQLAAGRFHLD